MPKKTVAKEVSSTAPVRVTKPKVASTGIARVKTVKHSKAAAPAVVETVVVNAHDQIAKIAYGYWVSRGFQHGAAEQDWLRAEREYLLQA